MKLIDLFNFIYENEKEKNEMLEIMVKAECSDGGRGAHIYYGFETPKKTDALYNEIANGYYLYISYAHFDDEAYLWYESWEEAEDEYEKIDIHVKYALEMEKRLIKVGNDSIEQLKMDKWKD